MTNTEYLCSLLNTLPPDLMKIENELKSKSYSSKEVTLAACIFCEECFLEYTDFIDEHKREPLEHEIHSSYVYDICKLLLKYGLDPNLVFGEKNFEFNLMYEIYWITKPYVAADTLRLLLAHSGDPMLPFDNEPLYDMVNFDIWFDITEKYYLEPSYAVKFDCRFHFWLVLLGSVSKEGSQEQQYLNHEDYIPEITKTDKYHWDIGVKRKPITNSKN